MKIIRQPIFVLKLIYFFLCYSNTQAKGGWPILAIYEPIASQDGYCRRGIELSIKNYFYFS